MKNLILSLCTLFFLNTIFAQQGQGMGGGMKGQHQGQQGAMMMQQKFNASNAVGILTYDAEKITKKLKIKDANIIKSINQAIYQYNRKIEEIKFLKGEDLKNISAAVNARRKEVMLTGNMQEMKETQMGAQELLAPIKHEIKAQDKKLNKTLGSILSEKQLKKWKKYQKKKKSALKPKKPSAGGNSQGRAGKSRGMGKGKGGGCNKGF